MSSHEDTRYVDLPATISDSALAQIEILLAYLKHGIGIFLSILQRRSFLLNTSSRNKTVKLALGLRDALDNLVQSWYIANIDLSVM